LVGEIIADLIGAFFGVFDSDSTGVLARFFGGSIGASNCRRFRTGKSPLRKFIEFDV